MNPGLRNEICGGLLLLAALMCCVLGVPHARAESPPQSTMTKLAAEDFHQREQAQAALQKWAERFPDDAKRDLFKALEQSKDPEVQARCRAVLKSVVLIDYLKAGEGCIGINLKEAPVQVPGDAGPRYCIVVQEVAPGCAAQRAGLRKGDQITAMDDAVWREAGAVEKFSQRTRATRPGTQVVLQVLRAGQVRAVPVTLMRLPPQSNVLMSDLKEWQRLDDQAKESFFLDWLNKCRAARR